MNIDLTKFVDKIDYAKIKRDITQTLERWSHEFETGDESDMRRLLQLATRMKDIALTNQMNSKTNEEKVNNQAIADIIDHWINHHQMNPGVNMEKFIKGNEYSLGVQLDRETTQHISNGFSYIGTYIESEKKIEENLSNLYNRNEDYGLFEDSYSKSSMEKKAKEHNWNLHEFHVFLHKKTNKFVVLRSSEIIIYSQKPNPGDSMPDETPVDKIKRLATTNQSTDEDSVFMQNVLRRVGFPNAKVVLGMVYIEGYGEPTTINSVAKMIAKILNIKTNPDDSMQKIGEVFQDEETGKTFIKENPKLTARELLDSMEKKQPPPPLSDEQKKAIRRKSENAWYDFNEKIQDAFKFDSPYSKEELKILEDALNEINNILGI